MKTSLILVALVAFCAASFGAARTDHYCGGNLNSIEAAINVCRNAIALHPGYSPCRLSQCSKIPVAVRHAQSRECTPPRPSQERLMKINHMNYFVRQMFSVCDERYFDSDSASSSDDINSSSFSNDIPAVLHPRQPAQQPFPSRGTGI